MDEDLIRIAHDVAIALRAGFFVDVTVVTDEDAGDYPMVKFYDDDYGHEVGLSVEGL